MLSNMCEAYDGAPCQHEWAGGLNCTGGNVFGSRCRGTWCGDAGFQFIWIANTPDGMKVILAEGSSLIEEMRRIAAADDDAAAEALFERLSDKETALWAERQSTSQNASENDP